MFFKMKTKIATSKVLMICLLASVLIVLLSSSVFAAGASMPWEGPLTKILNSISGPVAKVIGTLAIITCGLGLAFGSAEGGMKKGLQIVFGLCIAFTASSFFISFFGFAGGLKF
jgi:type IV secretion system protein VirB2